jgi:hypothetical protein
MNRVRQLERDRALKKLEVFKNIYEKITHEIYKQALANQNIYIHHIPEYTTANGRVDIDNALPWIISKLRNEGFTVKSLNGVSIDIGPIPKVRIGTIYDILIYWEKLGISECESMIKLDETEYDIQGSLLNTDRLRR